MTLSFAIIGGVTVAGAIGAMAFKNLVHCALSLVVAFAGLAALFLQLQAEFVGFAQVLVYVGAVAILIVFALLLTRGTDTPLSATIKAGTGWGIGIASIAFLTLAGAVMSSAVNKQVLPPKADVTVRAIGDKLMREYVLPLEVIGLLLTAAMIGAVIIAMAEQKKPK
jgi:NADH-quinone oxidoreductase subunit J